MILPKAGRALESDAARSARALRAAGVSPSRAWVFDRFPWRCRICRTSFRLRGFFAPCTRCGQGHDLPVRDTRGHRDTHSLTEWPATLDLRKAPE